MSCGACLGASQESGPHLSGRVEKRSAPRGCSTCRNQPRCGSRMLRLAVPLPGIHRAGLTGILAWPEHHHAADTDREHLQGRLARRDLAALSKREPIPTTSSFTSPRSACETCMQAFESCSSRQRMMAAVPVTPRTTGELSTGSNDRRPGQRPRRRF